ncbi:hypothetical protein EBZ39_15160, partial [bacterium]|nr:hypothetical protein [bacterium]
MCTPVDGGAIWVDQQTTLGGVCYTAVQWDSCDGPYGPIVLGITQNASLPIECLNASSSGGPKLAANPAFTKRPAHTAFSVRVRSNANETILPSHGVAPLALVSCAGYTPAWTHLGNIPSIDFDDICAQGYTTPAGTLINAAMLQIPGLATCTDAALMVTSYDAAL